MPDAPAEQRGRRDQLGVGSLGQADHLAQLLSQSRPVPVLQVQTGVAAGEVDLCQSDAKWLHGRQESGLANGYFIGKDRKIVRLHQWPSKPDQLHLDRLIQPSASSPGTSRKRPPAPPAPADRVVLFDGHVYGYSDSIGWGKVWTPPVIAHGRLYLRDQEHLFCYDIAARAAGNP